MGGSGMLDWFMWVVIGSLAAMAVHPNSGKALAAHPGLLAALLLSALAVALTVCL
jgi:hypothetical protein